MASKKNIRQTCLYLRRQLSAQDLEHHSKQVCNRIIALPLYQQARRIGLYYATDNEINLSLLSDHAQCHRKEVYFPLMTFEKTLLFLPVTQQTTFHKNSLGIQEPDVPITQQLSVARIDILLIPIVAFDQQGSRLGMGAGYYDRTLSCLRPRHLIGVAHDCQEQPALPVDPWDVPLDMIVTPQQVLIANV